jgi:hypothetical protein
MVASHIPDELKAVIARLEFKTVTSPQYRDMPHQWCGSRRNPADFQILAAAIQAHGVIEYYRGKGRRYLYVGEYRYWWMLHVINRMKIEDLSMSPPEWRVFRTLDDWRERRAPIGFD